MQAGRAIATPSAAAKGGRGSAGGAGGRLLGRREPEKRKTDAILEAAACFPAATPRCPRSSATQSNVARLGTQHPCLPRTGAIGTNARRCLNPSPKQRGHPGAPRRAIPGLCPLSPACHTSPRRPPALKTLPLTFVAAACRRRAAGTSGDSAQLLCPPPAPAWAHGRPPPPSAGVLPTERLSHRSAPGRRASRGGGGAALHPSPSLPPRWPPPRRGRSHFGNRLALSPSPRLDGGSGDQRGWGSNKQLKVSWSSWCPSRESQGLPARGHLSFSPNTSSSPGRLVCSSGQRSESG